MRLFLRSRSARRRRRAGGPVARKTGTSLNIAVAMTELTAWAGAASAVRPSAAAEPAERRFAAEAAWISEARNGGRNGPVLRVNRYLRLRSEVMEGHPRMEPACQEGCVKAVGLQAGDDWGKSRHGQLASEALLRRVVRRGSGCVWVPGTTSHFSPCLQAPVDYQRSAGRGGVAPP